MTAAALWCALGGVAGAQLPRIIHGVVLDGGDRPVPAAAVVAIGGATAVSDDSGRFRLEIAHHDRLVFDIRHVGFMPSRIALSPGGDTSFSILLLPTVQRLNPVEVKTPETRAPGLAGFEERMHERKNGAGVGYFITAKDIEQINPSRTTQVFETIPSVLVRRVDGGAGQRFAIFGHATGGGAECPATVFIDGIRLDGTSSGAVIVSRGRTAVSREPGVALDDYVAPSEIAGIEVYPRAIVAPSQFQPPTANGTKCAVAVIWTKHYR